MDDVHFKRLVDLLRHTEGQVRSELSAGRTLLARGERRQVVLDALNRLCAGPLPTPRAEDRNAFFIGRTTPAALAARMHGARFRKFWADSLVANEERRIGADALGQLGGVSECVEAKCDFCTQPSPIIGFDPPLTASAAGVEIGCRLFTLCLNCPRVAMLTDATLRADIEASLDDATVRTLRVMSPTTRN